MVHLILGLSGFVALAVLATVAARWPGTVIATAVVVAAGVASILIWLLHAIVQMVM